jgi:hypothetical protein
MAMNPTTKDALEMLRSPSPDFFTHLRGALTRAGLASEEKFGARIRPGHLSGKKIVAASIRWPREKER